MSRLHYLAAWIWIGLSLFLLGLTPPAPAGFEPGAGSGNRSGAAAWFQGVKPYCNSLEVELVLSQDPPPPGVEGAGFAAACLALAGRIPAARARIRELEGDARWRAAGIVFEVGHPVADAGDDASAGPIMELVVEFWPNHYMALYHAGVAAMGTGRRGQGWKYLSRFLEEYQGDDGWRRNALRLLGSNPLGWPE